MKSEDVWLMNNSVAKEAVVPDMLTDSSYPRINPSWLFSLSLVLNKTFHADMIHSFRKGYVDLIILERRVICHSSGIHVGELYYHIGYTRFSNPSGNVVFNVNSVVLTVLLSSVQDSTLKIVTISEQKMIKLFFIFMIYWCYNLMFNSMPK